MGSRRQARSLRLGISLGFLAAIGCASNPEGVFRPTGPPEVPRESKNPIVARQSVRIGQGSTSFRTPPGEPLRVLRLTLDASEVPYGIAAWVTLSWGDRSVGFELADGRSNKALLEIRRVSPIWPEEVVLPADTEVWVAARAYDWSLLHNQRNSAGEPRGGSDVEPFLSGPQDREIELSTPDSVLGIYLEEHSGT